MTDEELSSTEWITRQEFIPIGAWRRIRDNPEHIETFLRFLTGQMTREIYEAEGEDAGWNIDTLAHHGPEHMVPSLGFGVVVVLRAWRFKQ